MNRFSLSAIALAFSLSAALPAFATDGAPPPTPPAGVPAQKPAGASQFTVPAALQTIQTQLTTISQSQLPTISTELRDLKAATAANAASAANAQRGTVPPPAQESSPWLPAAGLAVLVLAAAGGLAGFLHSSISPRKIAQETQSLLNLPPKKEQAETKEDDKRPQDQQPNSPNQGPKKNKQDQTRQPQGEGQKKNEEVGGDYWTILQKRVEATETNGQSILQLLQKIQTALEIQPTAPKSSLDKVSEKVSGKFPAWLGKMFGASDENALTKKWQTQVQEFRKSLNDSLEKLSTQLTTEKSLATRKAELDKEKGELEQKKGELAQQDGFLKAREAKLKEQITAAQTQAVEQERKSIEGSARAFGATMEARIKALLASQGDLAKAQAKAIDLEQTKQEAESRAQKAETELKQATTDLALVRKEVEHLKSNQENAFAAKELEIRKELEEKSAQRIANLEAAANQARETLETERANARKAEEEAAKKLAAEQESHKIDVEAGEKKLSEEKASHAKDNVASAATIAGLETTVAGLEAQVKTNEGTIKKQATDLDAAQSRLYPAEIKGNPAFNALLDGPGPQEIDANAFLEKWDAEGKPGAALARAALAVFAQRSAPGFPAELWLRALADLSRGIAMCTMDLPADKAQKVLVEWKTSLEPLGRDPYFNLTIPAIGAPVNYQWMRVPPRTDKVSRVLSWAVYDQTACVHPAEIK